MKHKDTLNIFITVVDKKQKGIPVAIKDNFLTKGIRTTAGSILLSEFIPQYSATVVNRLLNNGYYIFGKTNLDAWCHGSSTETSDFGPTMNPYDKSRLAGGSSGGSAASVASGIVDVAIGSETAGSIRGPASWCGVIGLKPTYGRVSRYGVIAMGSSLDCPGVLAKSVKISADVLEIIAGYDLHDATSSKLNVPSYGKLLTGKINKLRVGVLENYFLKEADDDVIKNVKDVLIILEKLGAEIKYIKTIDPKYAVGAYTVIQRAEVASNLSRFDGIRFGKDRNYFGDEAIRRIMLGNYTLSAGYSDKYYKKALKIRTVYINDFSKIFSDVDICLAPTMPTVAPKIGITKDAAMYGEMADILAEPSSLAGLPAINVPCGFSKGLPVGFQLIGNYFREENILNCAYAYEQNK